MSEKQKTVTNWLFWGAFGVFLGVSIPHIAWIVYQYTPQDSNGFESVFYWVLALGYAIAIDGVMAWLTHASTAMKRFLCKENAITLAFVVALVLMSWYLNWLYNIAHDPSHQMGNAWNFVLIDSLNLWGHEIPQLTTGAFTPVLLGALPVFTLAYVVILNNVNQIKTQEAKSLDELRAEAAEAKERAKYLQEIRDAGKGEREGVNVIDGVFGAVGKVKNGVHGLRGEKHDPQQEMLQKVLSFFQDTPHLLTDETYTKSTEAMIRKMLKVNKEMATAWRIKAAEVVTGPEEKQPATQQEISQLAEAKVEVNVPSDEPDKLEQTMAFLQQYPDVTDEELAAELGMNRTAAARFWRLKAGEIATLNHAQKVEVKTERITAPLGTQGDSESGSELLPVDEGDMELFEEVSEEHYQTLYDTEPVTSEEPITDPEVEVINAKSDAVDGTATTQKSSAVNIMTRRKPLTIAEVAEALDCSERYVRDLRKNGKLVAEDPEGKLIKAGSVRSYLANRKVKVS